MEVEKIEREGTKEELEKDLESSGFHEEREPLEVTLARTRLQLDDAVQHILADSGLPIYLFIFLMKDIENDMREADMNVVRARMTRRKEGKKVGNTDQER